MKSTHPNVVNLREIADVRKPKTKKRLSISVSGLLVTLGAVLVLAVIAGGTYLYFGRSKTLSGSTELAQVESEVSRHYLLPTNEVPALATVADKSKLTSPFFAKAKDGDKVLIYQKNKIAIIYRPSIDRIIAVGPVDISSPSQASPQ